MTVGSQVKQCFYSVKGIEENLKSLSIKSTDKQAEKDLYDASQILKDVTNDLNQRISKLEKEEPQYKGF